MEIVGATVVPTRTPSSFDLRSEKCTYQNDKLKKGLYLREFRASVKLMGTVKTVDTKISLTLEQQEMLITLASEGKALQYIIESVCITSTMLTEYLNNTPQFSIRFQNARRDGMEFLADSLITIPDEYQDVQRGRLKSENIRWLLSKRKPTTYGDRVEVNVVQTVSIKDALNAAQNRVIDAARDVTESDNAIQHIDILAIGNEEKK